jgi:hypothetical protein
MHNIKVLVLGNDPQLNDIDFDKLDPSIIILGINRSWQKIDKDYLFFNDIEILKELIIQHKLSNISSNLISSDWLSIQSKKLKYTLPDNIQIFNRKDVSRFPDSVTCAIEIFSNKIKNASNITFYIAGVSLMWSEPSHFWKTSDQISLNTHNISWYKPRFNRILDNFNRLKSLGYTIISVHPNSRLNKIFRTADISSLYRNS